MIHSRITNKCLHCAYWVRCENEECTEERGEHGKCHRYPPTLLSNPDEDSLVDCELPSTAPDMFCGEFKGPAYTQ